MFLNPFHRSANSAASVRFVSGFLEIIDSTRSSCDALEALGPRFPLFRRLRWGRPYFVCLQFVQPLVFSPEHTNMRPKEFIGRANEKIASQCLHIDTAMWRKMDRINKQLDPGAVEQFCHSGDIHMRTDRIGC